MKQILSIVFAALFAMRTTPPSQAQSGAVLHDVVVYGDSSGAVVAAISAKREGRSVILVNPTGFPGGMSASGLGATDFLGRRGTFGGIASELYEGIDAAYGKDFVASFEPKVGRQVFEKMIADTAGVRRGDTKPRVHYRQGDKDHFVKDVDPYVASIAAGLTLEKDTSLQDVACDPLRERLIAEKQIIQPGQLTLFKQPTPLPSPLLDCHG